MKGYPTRAVAKFGGVLGTAVVALGFGAIGFGWYGAAGPGGRINGVPDLRAQLPYVLSGGSAWARTHQCWRSADRHRSASG